MAAAGLTDEDGAGRPRNFHSLRHTFASNLANAGVLPRQAQELMRHSSIELTMKRYTHTLLTDRSAAIARFPDLSASTDDTASSAKVG